MLSLQDQVVEQILNWPKQSVENGIAYIMGVALFTTASKARQRSTVPLQAPDSAPLLELLRPLTKLFRAVTLTHITPGI